MPEDIGGSERMLQQWQASIQEKADRYQEMASRVQGLSISETSKDGLIRLTIGSNGILQHLEIAEAAGTKRMAEVAGEVMRTLQKAQSRIPELLQQAMAETIGTQDETANVLFTEAKKNFPAPPSDDPPAAPQRAQEIRFGIEDDYEPSPGRHAAPPPPQPHRRPPRQDEDDDFDGQSFLR
nr:YbaB/EbfC family nucleoid-associated protein [Saccharothrix variisporea]